MLFRSPVFAQDIALNSLAPGGILDIPTPVALQAAAVGSYRVRGSVVDQQTQTVLASSEAQYQVQFDLSKALTGTVAAELATLDIGGTQTCTFTIRNGGSMAAANLEVHHSVVNIGSEQLVNDAIVAVSLDPNEENTGTRSFGTSGLTEGDYACVLRVKIGETFETLALAPFALTQPPIQVDATLALGTRGRLLVLLDPPIAADKDDDPHGPKTAPGLNAQRAFLETLLSSAGWSYTIVEDADAFTRELRSGGYTVYALFSEQEKLSEQVQEELREAIFRGESLVAAGPHDSRHHKLDEALGIKLKSNVSKATAVQLPAGPLEVEGLITLMDGDKVVETERQGAESLGIYLTGSAGTVDAVTTHVFGRGRGVAVGFDLLATATLDGQQSLAADLIHAALDHVHPSTVDQTVRNVVPITLVLENQGIATPVTVTIPIPAGTTVIDPGGGSFGEVTQTLSWSFDLAQAEIRTLTFWLQLTDTPSALVLAVSIEAPSGTDTVVVAGPTLTLTVLPAQDLPSLFATVDGLLQGDLDADVRQALERARRDLQDAEALLPDDPAKALKEALQAVDDLRAVDGNADSNLVRVMVGLWIKWLEQQI